jgi:hypothetical protein
MKDAIESARSLAVTISTGLSLVFLIVLVVKGENWLSARACPWLVILNTSVCGILMFVLLTFAISRRTRCFAGGVIYVTSVFFTSSLWAWSLLIGYKLWGILPVVIAILLMGAGVVPIAILASLFHGLWLIAGLLLLFEAAIFAVKQFGVFLIVKSENHDGTTDASVNR